MPTAASVRATEATGNLGSFDVIKTNFSPAQLRGHKFAAAKAPHFLGRAKQVVHLFMNSGPSQVGTFNPNPLPATYRRAGRASGLGVAAQVEQTSRPWRVTANSNVGWRHSGQTAASMFSISGSHTHSSRPMAVPADAETTAVCSSSLG